VSIIRDDTAEGRPVVELSLDLKATNADLKKIAAHKSLRVLSLNRCAKFPDAGLKELTALPNLHTLDLSDTLLTLYKETNRIFIDLITFRQLVDQKEPREDLYLAFTKVDMGLNQLLNDVQAFEKWDPAIRMAARRAQSALHETHFALATGDVSPARRSEDEARQAQMLKNRELDLEDMVGIVFLFDTAALKDWNGEFAPLRKNIAELQRLQKNKASREDVKQQLVRTDQSWEKLVTRFKGLSADQILQLREDFGRVDQVISRLCSSYGIKNRRAPLQINFLR
jgi:hypothetical protein